MKNKKLKTYRVQFSWQGKPSAVEKIVRAYSASEAVRSVDYPPAFIVGQRAVRIRAAGRR